MRRPLLLLAIAAVAALAAAGCTSSSTPGWTYAAPTAAPASAAPASPGAGGSPAAGSPAAGSPAAGSPAAGSPATGGGGAGIGAVQISALNIAFEQQTVSAPAGTAFVIHFDNKDQGQPHNIDIKDASGASVFKGDIITGPATADYQVPALTAGTYTFVCDVHSNMTGTLTAGS
jgi:plastocyanin